MGVQTLRAIYTTPSEARRQSAPNKERGWKCCFGIVRIGVCDPTNFFGNPHGIIKIIEVTLAFISQFILLKYGVKYAAGIGFSYHLILSVVSASFLTNAVLAVLFVTSNPSKVHIKSSLFELTFNFTLCALYLVISPFFALNVHTHLFYFFHTIPSFNAYPALTAAYIIGLVAGVIHGIDGFLSLRDYRRYN